MLVTADEKLNDFFANFLRQLSSRRPLVNAVNFFVLRHY